MKKVTEAQLSENAAAIMEELERTGRPVKVVRGRRAPMVLLPLAELTSMEETLHFFRTRAEAEVTVRALAEDARGEGTIFKDAYAARDEALRQTRRKTVRTA